MSKSNFMANSAYEYIYRPNMVPISSQTVVRIDRTPKGSPDSVVKNTFKAVVNEIKGFDLSTLTKVPESEKRHVYNIMVKGGVNGKG